MPSGNPDYEKCKREGGSFTRKTLKNGMYLNFCWDSNGKSHKSEPHCKKGYILKGKSPKDRQSKNNHRYCEKI